MNLSYFIEQVDYRQNLRLDLRSSDKTICCSAFQYPPRITRKVKLVDSGVTLELHHPTICRSVRVLVPFIWTHSQTFPPYHRGLDCFLLGSCRPKMILVQVKLTRSQAGPHLPKGRLFLATTSCSKLPLPHSGASRQPIPRRCLAGTN